MTTLTEEMPKAGEQYRFVVESAKEAVRVLRERLGDSARVVSVRQVEGAGLAKFLRAPKLEVIAEVVGAPASQEAVVEESPAGEVKVDLPEELLATPVAPEPASVVAMEPAPVAMEKEDSVSVPEPAPIPGEDLSRLLTRAGLPPVMLVRIKSQPSWTRIAELPLHMALNEITLLMRDQYQRQPQRALGPRVAFIGAAGAGKTTALCKWLAADVFVRRHQAAVLKVDLERANPSDGLAVFCEALGVPLSRCAADLPNLLPNEKVYVDLPGIGLGDENEIALYSQALAELAVTTRVLVINAAYEAGIIRQIYEAGARLAATHVVFTHLDELTQWGKLWEFVLGHDLTPLFLSSGQSIAGDFVEAVFPSILARTFPSAGSEIAKTEAVL
jgi:flagellar biosynthesis protein FlhF